MKQVVALLLSVLSLASVGAATYRVDEAGTFPAESSAPMRWRQIAPSRGGDNTVEGSTTVNVRLNLAPWLNRNGRLFLVLPQQPVVQVRASWTTQGRLMPGQLTSGDRQLVYSGPITTPMLEDTLALTLETDGTRLSSALRLQFHFEIDVE
ncbi:MAG TPA: hypothetical protein PLW72_01750 [Burkholderiaceae bacterium]|nr:hypothetical protein [Burkholderiaceae bacterium]HQR74960.1 hypothetical protein [Burkholderiaceae bacterium]